MATFVCDWCNSHGDSSDEGASSWLMGALRHTAGAASGHERLHAVTKPGRLVRACSGCAPLVRARDVDGLTDRVVAVLAAAGQTAPINRVEHGLILRSIDRALVGEVADETARPSAEQRKAWALASARANATAMGDLAPRGRSHGHAEKAV